MVPAKDALLISWLQTGDVREVAHRLCSELGDDRLRELWAHLLPMLSPPDRPAALPGQMDLDGSLASGRGRRPGH